jgi:hypothetical protein
MRMLDKYYREIELRAKRDFVNMGLEPASPTAFDVQNVFEWAKNDRTNDGWVINVGPRGDIYTLVPPYPSLWMEFVSIIKDEGLPDEKHKWGVYVTSERDYSESLPKPNWFVSMRFWRDSRNTLIDMGNSSFAVDEEGRIIDNYYGSNGSMYFERSNDMKIRNIEWRMAMEICEVPLAVAMAAISLSNTNGIVYQDTIIPPKIRKKRAKNGYPNIQFKTLGLEPLKSKCRKRYAENPNGAKSLELALHLVRGHPKDYRKSGLFGDPNKKGIYWWGAHARGNENNGIIVKDYEINTNSD